MKFRILLLLMLVLAACTAQPDPAEPVTQPPDTVVTNPPGDSTQEPGADPLAPQPGDADLSRGEVFINEKELLIRESFPPQIALVLRGDLPTPCHALRAVVADPDRDNKIAVEVYSVTDPDTACTQVLEPFEEQLELGTFPTGHYSVWVNGELAGEFDS